MQGFVARLLRTLRERRWWRWRKAIGALLLLACLALGRHRLAAEYHYVWIVAHVSSSSMVSHMRGLEAVEDGGAIPPLLRLLRSSNPQLRSFAAQTLRRHPGRHVVDALIRAVREDPDEDTQMVAIGSLGEIADPRALPTLKTLATSNTPALHALVFFGALGKQSLLDQLAGGSAPDWRAGALAELCGYYEPTVFLADSAVRQEVKQRLSDTAWQVRAAAAQCVAKMAGAPKSEWLRALLEDPEPMVRLEAASELGKLGDRSGFEATARILADVTLAREVRARAALTLKDVKDPRAYRVLCDAMRSKEPYMVFDRAKVALEDLFWTDRAHDPAPRCE